MTVNSGTFTSAGTAATLVLPSSVDWIKVYNYTQAATQQSTGRGVEFYWQKGMAQDTGLEWKKTNSTDALNLVTLTSGGFTLVDSSVSVLSATLTGTTIDKTSYVASVTNTYADGDVVRIYKATGMDQINGIDFTISSTGGSSFVLSAMVGTAFAADASAFKVARVPYDPIFYPRHRTIGQFTSSGTSTIITTTVNHGYQDGQVVRLVIPSIYGSASNLNGVTGTITSTATNAYTFTVDIDSSAVSFAWPATGNQPFSPAQVVPVGDNTSYDVQNNLNVLSGATLNEGYVGIKLAAGAQSPAGSASDVIYWVAGTSFSANAVNPL